jgi:pimeloyl-ACP methyl ester carboxylesterase
MLSDSNKSMGNNVHLYLLAGVATAPLFMESLRVALHEKLTRSSGRIVYSELLFPYGDRSRRLIPQLWEIRHDMRLGLRRLTSSIGGTRTLNSILSRKEGDDNPSILLIGHSGGGVAAVHAAQLLIQREYGSTCPVILIGSPRCRIPDGLRDSVLSISATGKDLDIAKPGNSRDFVSRLGTFGGWSKPLELLPRWKADKHAPLSNHAVPIIGGHADYFRNSAPFINSFGQSNLDLMLEIIESWLIRWN